MSSAGKRYHVIISERAGEMLVQHARFLAQVSTQAADKLRIDIIEAAKSLQEFPERGSWLTDPLLPGDTEGLNFRRAFVDAGFHLSNVCVWVKNSMVTGRCDYHWQHEPILYGWKPTGSHKWYADRKQTTVWNYDRPSRNAEHPTMKPVGLVAYPIKNSSMANCIVPRPLLAALYSVIETQEEGYHG